MHSITNGNQLRSITPAAACVNSNLHRGCTWNYWLAPNKGFEPVHVIMAQCSPFNQMLSSTYLIVVHILLCVWDELSQYTSGHLDENSFKTMRIGQKYENLKFSHSYKIFSSKWMRNIDYRVNNLSQEVNFLI